MRKPVSIIAGSGSPVAGGLSSRRPSPKRYGSRVTDPRIFSEVVEGIGY